MKHQKFWLFIMQGTGKSLESIMEGERSCKTYRLRAAGAQQATQIIHKHLLAGLIPNWPQGQVSLSKMLTCKLPLNKRQMLCMMLVPDYLDLSNYIGKAHLSV